MFRGKLRDWIALTLSLLAGGIALLSCQSGDVSIQTDDGGTEGICQATVDTLDFGQVAVGGSAFVDRVFFLRNLGGGPARGTATSRDPVFSLEDGGGGFLLIPGERRTVRVRFLPVARGEFRSEVRFGGLCRPVVLIGRGVDPARCVVAPEVLDFRDVRIGEVRSLVAIVRNAGEDTLRGAVASPCAEFRVVAGAGAFRLGPDDSIAARVFFRPDQPGPAECLLQLGLTCGDVRMSGVGHLPPSCALETPAGRNFGAVALGSSAELPLVVKNTGGDGLAGHLAWSGCAGFTVAGDPDFDLLAGEARTYTLRFVPTESGTSSCRLDAGVACGGLDFAGSGEEAPACRLEAPDGNDFGPVPLGTPAERPVVVTNTGGGRLRGALRLDCADFSIADPSYDLGREESDTLVVTFFPQSLGTSRCSIASVDGVCQGLEMVGLGLRNSTCDVTAESFDFGSVLLGSEGTLTFTIDNAGDVALLGAASVTGAYPEFAFDGAAEVPVSVAPRGRQSLTLRFRPTQTGPRTATVVLSPSACVDLVFTGRGDDPPVCVLEPAGGIAFGDVAAGSALEMTFTLRNDGGGVLEGAVGIPSDCPGFTIADTDLTYRLLRRERRTFTVRFAPAAPGAASCLIDPGQAACPAVACTGLGIAPAGCQVDAADRDFGLVTLGGAAELPLVLRNLGGQPLAGALSFGSSYPEFAVDGLESTPYDIEAGGYRTFALRFAPASAGVRVAALDLGNDLCGDVVSWSGTGEPPPSCSVETEGGVDFGSLAPGASDTLSFRIRNSGGGVLSGAASIDPACDAMRLEGEAGYALTGGASARIVVRFTPPSAGAFSCAVDPGASCAPVVLNGAGETPPACLVAPAQGIDFGPRTIGTTSAASFTITNAGGGVLAGSLSEACAEYSVDPRDYSIPAGGHQAFTVSFRPLQVGPRTCTLALGGDCGSIPLSGVGETAPSCWIQPTGLNFETVAVGASKDLTIAIRNNGGGTLAGTAAIVPSGDSDQFQITGSPAYSLAAQSSATLHARFAPTSAGSKAVVLDLGNAACAGPFLLEGTGDPPPHCNIGAQALDLGNVPFDGSTTATRSFLIENDGGGTLDVDVPAACGPFTIVGGGGAHTIPGGGRLTVSVRYMPGGFGDETCDLDVQGCETVQLRGHGGVSFAHHLLPFLAYGVERGCGLDGCHAQGGMSAYWGDYATTRYNVDTGNPDMSPLLRMALGLDGHSGGQVWTLGDPEFQKTRTWIAEGAEDN